MDYDKRRREITAAMDSNSQAQVKLVNEMAALQKEFRELELRQHQERATLRLSRKQAPTGIIK